MPYMKKITSFFKTIKAALIKCKTNHHFTACLCAQPVPALLLQGGWLALNQMLLPSFDQTRRGADAQMKEAFLISSQRRQRHRTNTKRAQRSSGRSCVSRARMIATHSLKQKKKREL